MKLVKTANNVELKMSHKEWLQIGKKAGWGGEINDYGGEGTPDQYDDGYMNQMMLEFEQLWAAAKQSRLRIARDVKERMMSAKAKLDELVTYYNSFEDEEPEPDYDNNPDNPYLEDESIFYEKDTPKPQF